VTNLTPSQKETARKGAVVGIAWMVLSSAVAVSTHAMVRHASSGDIHPFEVAFFYNLFTLAIIVPLVVRGGTSVLRTRRHGLMFVRAVLHLSSMLLFYMGLVRVPLAMSSALTFLAPLFAVLLAAILLKEGFSPRRVIALMAGFIGMLIIIRPNPAALDTTAFLLVGAVLDDTDTGSDRLAGPGRKPWRLCPMGDDASITIQRDQRRDADRFSASGLGHSDRIGRLQGNSRPIHLDRRRHHFWIVGLANLA
jgi:uncharacterized membrane protein